MEMMEIEKIEKMVKMINNKEEFYDEKEKR